jgi:hypothetical protein
MNEKVIGVILIIIALAGAVYVYQQLPQYLGGGILNFAPGSGADIKPPRIPTGAIYNRPTVNIKAGSGGGFISAGYGSGSDKTISQQTLKPVRIASVSPKSYGSPNYSTVNLSIDSDADLTGWKIKSKTDYFIIPQAYQYYSGTGSSLANIKPKKGERVAIYSHTGAIIPGFSINKCMGYLTKSANFTPSFYASCPSEPIKNIADYSSQCQDYVRFLSSCPTNVSNPPIRPDDFQCLDYLKKLNYQSCLELHRTDADFYSGEWRIWLGDSFGNSKLIFDLSHDKVGLYDLSGKLVDEYVY